MAENGSNEQIQVSIIVPVFNREKCLPICLDSIRKQSYKNYECLLVDDGSSDNSLAICKEYSGQDTRFKTFHQENGGVASARNLGLDHASGEWVVFVDSDDEILPFHLEQLLSPILSNDTIVTSSIDIVFCGCKYVGGIQRADHVYTSNKYLGLNEVKDFLINTDVLQYMYACDRMYRKSLLDEYKIRFDTTLAISEDRYLCYQVLKYVGGVATVPLASYVINASDGNSLSRRTLSSDICINRYCKLSSAMQELVDVYNLYDNKISSLWKYNVDLLVMAIHSLYNVKGNIFKAVSRQDDFMNNYFDVNFYQKIAKIPAVEEIMEDKLLQSIVKHQFFKINLLTLLKFIQYKFQQNCR